MQSPSSQHRPPPASAQLSGDPAPSLSHAARAWPVRLERHEGWRSRWGHHHTLGSPSEPRLEQGQRS